MPKLYAGLDVSLASTSVCIVTGSGKPVLETSVPTSPKDIALVLKPYRVMLERVAHEAGLQAPWLHKGLVRARLPVIMLDAKKVRAALIAQRNKTDRNDARDIAILLTRGFDERVYVKSDAAHEARILLAHRRVLRRKATDVEIALGVTLRAFGARLEKTGERVRVVYNGKRGISKLRRLSEPMLRARAMLLSETKAMDQEIAGIAKSDPICRRLMTVPSIGPYTALVFRSAVDDPHRFASSRLVGAYFGLSPRRIQSGQRDFGGRISKFGDHEVRRALQNSACVLLSRSASKSTLRRWGLRLKEAKGFNVAAAAVARKLAVVMHRMWITERDFELEPKPS